MNPINRLYDYYQRHGAHKTGSRVLAEMSILIFSFVFLIIDRLVPDRDHVVGIVPRESRLDQDTLALILQTNGSHQKYDLNIFVRDTQIIQKDYDSLQAELENCPSFLKINSLSGVVQLAKSGCICVKSDNSLRHYRIFSNKRKRFIRIHHGIITKGYGESRNDFADKDKLFTISYNGTRRIDIKSVSSEIEMYFRAAAGKQRISKFRKFGYPRFDRLKSLKSGDATPVLPQKTSQTFKDTRDSVRVLYAPTHKDKEYDTSLFPFPNFDIEEFRSFLRENNIKIFIRMHISEEHKQHYNEYVDNRTIYYAGHSFSSSVVEIAPYFDALITDYSSVYMDFLPMNKPIIFLKDDIGKFRRNRGFAFDYETYFPGPKFEKFGPFLTYLSNLESADKDYAQQREFVRKSFLPEKNQSFIEMLEKENLIK